MIDEGTKKKALVRLKRIEGQVQGVQRMVEETRYCIDILQQLSAIRGALDQVSLIVMERHIDSCVAEAIKSGNGAARKEKIEELMEALSKFAK